MRISPKTIYLTLYSSILITASCTPPFPELPGSRGEVLDPLTHGKTLYQAKCAYCHLPDFKGIPEFYPPLDTSVWLTKELQQPEPAILITLHGLTGTPTITNRNYAGVMVGSRLQLNNTQIAAILNYIRMENATSPPLLTPEDIEKVRQNSIKRNNPWTTPELHSAYPKFSTP